jgi:hypothetical protein
MGYWGATYVAKRYVHLMWRGLSFYTFTLIRACPLPSTRHWIQPNEKPEVDYVSRVWGYRRYFDVGGLTRNSPMDILNVQPMLVKHNLDH